MRRSTLRTILIGVAIVLLAIVTSRTARGAAPPAVPGYEPLNDAGFVSRWGTGYFVLVSSAPIDGSKPLVTPAVPAGWAVYAGPVPTVLDEPARALVVVRQVKLISLPPATAPAVGGATTPPREIPIPAGAVVVRAGERLPVPRNDQVIALESSGSWSGQWHVTADRVRVVRFGDPTRRPRISADTTALFVSGDGCSFDGIDFVGSDRKGIGVRVWDAKAVTGFRDCTVRDFGWGVAAENSDTVRLVDCRVIDNFGAPNMHAQGYYGGNVRRVELLGCVFDRNGGSGKNRKTNIFDHSVYVRADCGPSLIVGNVFARGSSHGAQIRSGGTVEGNLFLDNPIHLSFGHVNGEGPVFAGGVSGSVANNVFLGTDEIGGQPRGRGVDVANVLKATIANNVFAAGGPDAAIRLEWCNLSPGAKGKSVGIRDLAIRGNVVAPGWAPFWRHDKAGVVKLDKQVSFAGKARDARGSIDLEAIRAGKVKPADAIAAARAEATK